jgi:hypothetical protein
VAGGQSRRHIARRVPFDLSRNKSLFASFSSEKEESCSFSEEKEPKRLYVSGLRVRRSGIVRTVNG